MEDETEGFKMCSGRGRLFEVDAVLLSIALSDVSYLIAGDFPRVVTFTFTDEFAVHGMSFIWNRGMRYQDKDLQVR